MATPSRNGEHRGAIVAIGGAEDKLRSRVVLRKVLQLAGGDDAHIAVIPTASRLSDTGDRYAQLFRELGARDVSVLPFCTRADGADATLVGALHHATGIFMTGGNQLRLSTVLGGTPAAREIRHRNADGAVVAGTSAGAAILCEHMIAYGNEGPTPRAGMVTLAPGFGLVNSVIIDQHFRQRDRLGRLLTALAYNPYEIGIGLDEDTAAVIQGSVISVLGSSAVTIVDASELEHSGMGFVRQGQPVSLTGLRLHILVDGGSFRIDTREAQPGEVSAATVDKSQLIAADHDVKLGRPGNGFTEDDVKGFSTPEGLDE